MKDRQPLEAYQIVCNDFYKFAKEINNIRGNDSRKFEKEWEQVVCILNRGMGQCSLWGTSSDCMDFFSDLHVAIYKTSRAYTD